MLNEMAAECYREYREAGWTNDDIGE